MTAANHRNCDRILVLLSEIARLRVALHGAKPLDTFPSLLMELQSV